MSVDDEFQSCIVSGCGLLRGHAGSCQKVELLDLAEDLYDTLARSVCAGDARLVLALVADRIQRIEAKAVLTYRDRVATEARLASDSERVLEQARAEHLAIVSQLRRADSVIRAQAHDLEEARELAGQRKTEAERLLNAVRLAANVGTMDSGLVVQAVGALRNDLVDTRAELEAEKKKAKPSQILAERREANPNRAKLQAVYVASCDAQLKTIENGFLPEAPVLEQLQSLYRLLEDPA